MIASQIATLIPIITKLAMEDAPGFRSDGRPVRTWAVAEATHAGHWNPTEPGTMQSGQMGRSHR